MSHSFKIFPLKVWGAVPDRRAMKISSPHCPKYLVREEALAVLEHAFVKHFRKFGKNVFNTCTRLVSVCPDIACTQHCLSSCKIHYNGHFKIICPKRAAAWIQIEPKIGHIKLDINATYGDEAVFKRTAQNWLTWLRAGEYILQHAPRRSRPPR